MKTITKIEANRSAAVHRKCRVAAYCRVSTEHDDQIESLVTQKEHYAAWIKLHTEWESVGIFYDAGITGTKAEIRPGLQDLLQRSASLLFGNYQELGFPFSLKKKI